MRDLGFRWFTLLHNIDLRRGDEQSLFLTTYPSAWLEEVLEERHYIEGSVAKIVKLEHAWRRLDGRNDDGFQVAPFPG
ncbi:autoinducer binding domain-containing protein [Sphingobium quisquiliarum]|uniref:autoinducer binding domain-containing protein n=1 Tax=Sphingobium quisquiliarum TaxID=538379 RepID=UPI001F2F0BAB|nr:autoinducer binding domain-containing protein [Sphingobium quisquiliarum]